MKRRNAVTRKAAGVLFVIAGLLLLAGCCKFAAKRGGVFQCGPKAVMRFPECPRVAGVRPEDPADDGTFTCRVAPHAKPPKPYCHTGASYCGCYVGRGVEDSTDLFQWRMCPEENE